LFGGQQKHIVYSVSNLNIPFFKVPILKNEDTSKKKKKKKIGSSKLLSSIVAVLQN